MIKSLQSLRFVFIMLVVMSYIIGKSFDFGGECGVSFFFVLSGFILSYAYGRQVQNGKFRWKRFLKKQLLKFYPLHLVTFLVMVALDARLERYFSWPKLLANALLLQSWVPSDDFYFVANGSSWFLSDLLFFYVVFGVLFTWLNSVSLRKLIFVGAAVLGLYVVLAVSIPTSMVNPLLYASPATRLLDFALGILLFRFSVSASAGQVERWLGRQSAGCISLIEVLLVCWVVLSFFVYERSAIGFRCASMFWGVSPVVLFGFVKTDKLRGVVTLCLHHPVMQWLGSISFEIYLTHWITMRIFYSLLSSAGIGEEGRVVLGVMVATILLIFVVSYLTKRFFVDKVYATLIKYV